MYFIDVQYQQVAETIESDGGSSSYPQKWGILAAVQQMCHQKGKHIVSCYRYAFIYKAILCRQDHLSTFSTISGMSIVTLKWISKQKSFGYSRNSWNLKSSFCRCLYFGKECPLFLFLVKKLSKWQEARGKLQPRLQPLLTLSVNSGFMVIVSQ